MNLSRRRFIASSLLSGTILGCARSSPIESITRWGKIFGSQSRLTVRSRNKAAATKMIAGVFARLDQLEENLSLYRPTSAICRLNREGELLKPPQELLRLLETAGRLSKISDGAFDITVQPLWELYTQASKENREPSAEEIAKTRELIDWRAVEFNADRIRFAKKGMKITLNALAQGFAADLAAEMLQKEGYEDFLIDTGEFRASGESESQNGWRIGIKDPRDAKNILGSLDLHDRSLATSGSYATRLGPQNESHHLFDPKTGRSTESFSSVTVEADTALEADGLATTLSVANRDLFSQIVANYPRAKTLCLDANGNPLPEFTTLVVQ